MEEEERVPFRVRQISFHFPGTVAQGNDTGPQYLIGCNGQPCTWEPPAQIPDGEDGKTRTEKHYRKESKLGDKLRVSGSAQRSGDQ